MSELKIDSERVLKASESCPQAKEILKTLFPEVFKKEATWEDVTDQVVFTKGLIEPKDIQETTQSVTNYLSIRDSGGVPFALLSAFNHDKDYKIENGKLWRLKNERDIFK